MIGFLVRRIAVLIPTFIGVSIIAFLFIRLLPGDPVALLSGERVMSPERHAQISAALGLDRPLVIQYFDYLKGILTGDFGTSIVSKSPIIDQFFALFPATVELSFCAIILAICIGIPAGVIAAIKRGSVFDQGLMGIALVGYSMPIFWWGLLLIILFSGILQWTPVSGRISLMFYFPPVTGFMLIDSLLSGQKGHSPPRLAIWRCRRSCLPPFRSPSLRARRARPCWKCCRKTMCAPHAPRACLPSG